MVPVASHPFLLARSHCVDRAYCCREVGGFSRRHPPVGSLYHLPPPPPAFLLNFGLRRWLDSKSDISVVSYFADGVSGGGTGLSWPTTLPLHVCANLLLGNPDMDWPSFTMSRILIRITACRCYPWIVPTSGYARLAGKLQSQKACI
jgi:hypothetical protein